MVCSNLLLIPGDIQEKLKDLFNTSKNIGHLIENGEIPTEIFFNPVNCLLGLFSAFHSLRIKKDIPIRIDIVNNANYCGFLPLPVNLSVFWLTFMYIYSKVLRCFGYPKNSFNYTYGSLYVE